MRISRVQALAAAGLLLTLAACGKKEAPPAAANPAVVARVNGEAITRAQLDERLAREIARLPTREGVKGAAALEDRAREAAMRALVDEAVVGQKARELNVAVTDAEVEARYAQQRERIGDEAAFKDYLERTRTTPEDLKVEIRRALVEEGIAEKMGGPVSVTDAEVAKGYESERDRYVEKERVRVSRIAVRGEDAATRAKAQALRAKALVKASDFAELARKSSEAPEGKSGGELGWVERGRMGGEFDAAAFNLSNGAVSRVYRGPVGYEFVKVWEKLPRRSQSLKEATPAIRAELESRRRDQRRSETLSAVRGAAQVELVAPLQAKKAI